MAGTAQILIAPSLDPSAAGVCFDNAQQGGIRLKTSMALYAALTTRMAP